MASYFTYRSEQLEIMDDLTCSGKVVERTLRELDTINSLLGGNNATIDGVHQLIDQKNNKPISLVDLGCGSGKILNILSTEIRSNQISLLGIDANPNIIEFASKHNSLGERIQYKASDILSDQFKTTQYDIAVATLFFHHFSDEQLVDILTNLKNQCRIGIVINDLHRHWFAYWSIRVLTLLFSRSSMVKFDAPVSVLRGFTRRELNSLLSEAGIKDFSIQWKWAFRWQIVIRS
jgi:2-polyprenyl-3-methyl-5-hydroxy-6-metoxy-1,4-benzoquinol methylase